MHGKWIYLAQRNARYTREEFHERWLAHRRIGTPPPMLGEFAGGTYCAAESVDLALASRSEEYDGAGVFTLNGLHSIPLVAQCLKLDYIQADEKRFFSATSDSVSLFAAERLVRDGDDTETVVLQFLRRPRDIGASDFARAWGDAHAAAVNTEPTLAAPALSRYVQNTVIAPPPPGMGYDAVAEFWFRSPEAVREAAGALDRLMTESPCIDPNNSFCLLTRTIMNRPRAR